jgi:hypothetical protein
MWAENASSGHLVARPKQPATEAADAPDARLRTIDHGIGLGDQIGNMPAHGLEGIAIKLWAITWFLDETDAVLDIKGLRQLRALDREARRVGGSLSPAGAVLNRRMAANDSDCLWPIWSS